MEHIKDKYIGFNMQKPCWNVRKSVTLEVGDVGRKYYKNKSAMTCKKNSRRMLTFWEFRGFGRRLRSEIVIHPSRNLSNKHTTKRFPDFLQRLKPIIPHILLLIWKKTLRIWKDGSKQWITRWYQIHIKPRAIKRRKNRKFLSCSFISTKIHYYSR